MLSMKNGKARFYLTLVIFSLVGQVAWVVENMYFNVFLYRMFHASAGAISAMVAASAAAAAVTTLLMGALSDKLGRRKAFICGGYLIWGITIWSFAFIREDVIAAVFPGLSVAAVGVTLVIIMDCVMTFFGSTANDACFNAWLTDMTDETNRGAAEGINAMMPLLAVLVVFGGFMGFDLDRGESWVSIFTIIGVVVTLIGIGGLFLLEEPDLRKREKQNYFANILYGFRPKAVRENPVLYKTLLAVAALGFLQQGAGQIFLALGIRQTSPVTAGLISGIEPILNPILVAVFYHEMLSPLALLGAGIVLVSVMGYNYRTASRKESPAAS